MVELSECLRIYRMHNDRSHLVSCLNNMGYVYQSKNMFPDALEPFTEALTVMRQFHNNRPHQEIAEQLNQLANANYKVGRVSAAYGQLEEAVGILRNVAPNHPRLKEFENGLAVVKLKMQETQVASAPTATPTEPGPEAAAKKAKPSEKRTGKKGTEKKSS
jgi:tetratricopeptide (TPR) repeat protein